MLLSFLTLPLAVVAVHYNSPTFLVRRLALGPTGPVIRAALHHCLSTIGNHAEAVKGIALRFLSSQ